MPIQLKGYEERTAAAVSQYWKVLAREANKKKKSQGAGDGRRGVVVSGKQMDGFCELLRWFLTANGMPDASIHTKKKMEIPGFYRATKKWDLLVIHQQNLVACCEFKSQVGSIGNNLNNRAEEALGIAEDVTTAVREEAFGRGRPVPWLGWLMLLEDSEKTRKPVRLSEPNFKVFPEFKGATYADRYGILLNKMILEKKYDAAALILSPPDEGMDGMYSEPEQNLGMRRFLAELGGHISGYLASL